MEKLLRILRSCFFLAAFCILLEFVQLLAVFILLYEFFLPITIPCWIFHVCVLLYLLNRDEIPAFKLSCLIILLLLPVVGVFIFFMLLSSNESSQKSTERCAQVWQEMKPYRRQLGALDAGAGQ